jgi:hypothetical protein
MFGSIYYQMLKQVQAQLQVLAKKSPRTPQENALFQKLILEQNKILASGKLVPTIPGQHAQGLQFVRSPLFSIDICGMIM